MPGGTIHFQFNHFSVNKTIISVLILLSVVSILIGYNYLDNINGLFLKQYLFDASIPSNALNPGETRIDDVMLVLFLWPHRTKTREQYYDKELHYKNVMHIISQVTENKFIDYNNIYVINQDNEYNYINDSNIYYNWINIDIFGFTNHLITAINIYHNKRLTNKVLYFQIMCDCSFKYNWVHILKKAVTTYNNYNIGMYQPDISGGAWSQTFKNIQCPSDKLKHSWTTDPITLSMSYEIIDFFLDRKNGFIQCFDHNTLGWGIGHVFNVITYYLHKFWIYDFEYQVDHPIGSGYDHTLAGKEYRSTNRCIWNNINNLKFGTIYSKYHKLPSNIKAILNQTNFKQKCILIE
eukprot:389020_1